MTLYERIEHDFIKHTKLNYKAKLHALLLFGKRNYLKTLFSRDTNLQREVAKRMLVADKLDYKEYAQFIGELNEQETNREEQ